MLEVFTIGGGEYIVNVLNAVAAWSGGGGYRSLIQVVMVMGFIYSLFVVAFSLDWRAWFNWFLTSTLIYMMLLVPTVSIKVTDRVDPGLAPAVVDNVPLGLGVMASFTSQVGDWLTRTAETVFVMPNALALSNNGMIYGARLLEKAQTFQITDSLFRANLDEHLKQCTFYDVLLGFKSMDDLTRAHDLWAAIGPGSPARSQKWISSTGAGTTEASIIPCNEAYDRMTVDWTDQFNKDLLPFAKSAYPKLADTVAAQKIKEDLPIVAQQMHGSSTDAYAYLKQVSMIDSFRAARDGFSDAGWDAYASQRADAQARNTYTSIAQQAMTWVPLLGIVLTVVFYAMFPVLFPLFLFPRTGVPDAERLCHGLFLSGVLGTALRGLAHVRDEPRGRCGAGGRTGWSDAPRDRRYPGVNNDISTVAGFLMMSVPFLAAGMARGAMAVAGQATTMLAPAQSAAEAAAVERTTGNYSYGNTSFANLNSNMVQSNKWDTAPVFNSGFARSSFINDDGSTTSSMSSGATVFNTSGSISNLPMKFSTTSGGVAEMRESASEYHSQANQLRNSVGESWAAGHRNSNTLSSGSRSSGGSEGSSGTDHGSTTTIYDRNGRATSDRNDQSRTISDNTRSSESSRDVYTASTNTAMNLSGSVSSGPRSGKAGGVLGRFLGNAGAGAAINYGKSGSDGVQFDRESNETRSDQNSYGSSSSSDRTHGNGRDVQSSDGSYSREGSFRRDESFSGNTNTSESYDDYAQRINREAAALDERGERLERAASYAETHGYTLNEDMSQYLTSRYLELQHGEMRSLDLPDLYRTDLTNDQRERRAIAVHAAMNDFIQAPRSGVEGRLQESGIARVVAPKDATPESLSGAVSAPSGGKRRSISNDGGRSERQGEIAAGSQTIDDSLKQSDVMHAQAIEGTSAVHDEHNRRANREWFSKRK